jgi:iron complex transport system ATP-binding protein
LKLTGAWHIKDKKMGNLSGGERQTVFIAGAIAQEAEILLLDEPAAFLDPKHQTEISELLNMLNSSLGLTIVLVSHDLNSTALWPGRIVALREGQIVFNGSGRELMTEKSLEIIYDTKFIFAEHPQNGMPCVVPSGKVQ